MCERPQCIKPVRYAHWCELHFIEAADAIRRYKRSGNRLEQLLGKNAVSQIFANNLPDEITAALGSARRVRYVAHLIDRHAKHREEAQSAVFTTACPRHLHVVHNLRQCRDKFHALAEKLEKAERSATPDAKQPEPEYEPDEKEETDSTITKPGHDLKNQNQGRCQDLKNQNQGRGQGQGQGQGHSYTEKQVDEILDLYISELALDRSRFDQRLALARHRVETVVTCCRTGGHERSSYTQDARRRNEDSLAFHLLSATSVPIPLVDVRIRGTDVSDTRPLDWNYSSVILPRSFVELTVCFVNMWELCEKSHAKEIERWSQQECAPLVACLLLTLPNVLPLLSRRFAASVSKYLPSSPPQNSATFHRHLTRLKTLDRLLVRMQQDSWHLDTAKLQSRRAYAQTRAERAHILSLLQRMPGWLPMSPETWAEAIESMAHIPCRGAFAGKDPRWTALANILSRAPDFALWKTKFESALFIVFSECIVACQNVLQAGNDLALHVIARTLLWWQMHSTCSPGGSIELASIAETKDAKELASLQYESAKQETLFNSPVVPLGFHDKNRPDDNANTMRQAIDQEYTRMPHWKKGTMDERMRVLYGEDTRFSWTQGGGSQAVSTDGLIRVWGAFTSWEPHIVRDNLLRMH
jgi:hypothetical protein